MSEPSEVNADELKGLHLSAGQRRALLGLPKRRDFRPCYTGFQWPTLAHLKSKCLINSVIDGLGGMGPKAMHRLTPKGQRVRALLEADPDCHASAVIDDPRNGGSEPGSWARHIRDTEYMRSPCPIEPTEDRTPSGGAASDCPASIVFQPEEN